MTILFYDQTGETSELSITMGEKELTIGIEEYALPYVSVTITEDTIDEFIEILTELRNKNLSFE